MTTLHAQEMKRMNEKWEQDQALLKRTKLTMKEIEGIKKQSINHLTTYAWSPTFPKVRVCSRRLEMLCDMALETLLKQTDFFE